MTTTSSSHRRKRNRILARTAPIFAAAILFVIAFGAFAAPRFHAQDRDWDHGRVWVSRERTAQDFGGGDGGRPSPDAQCPPDSVAVGFHVQTGEYFNQAWLDCAPLRPDGRLGDELAMTERTGSPDGRPVHDAICPKWFALRGLRGRSGASIDEAAGECSPLRDIADRLDHPRTEWTASAQRPNPGGHPSQADCPLGFAVTGFRSRSGEYMDHLWVICSELHHEH